MSTQVQFRRGTAAENDAFTGALAEVTVNTTDNTLRVHDGVTVGGFTMVGLAATQTLTNKTLIAPDIGAATGTSLTVGTGNISGGNINNNNTTGVGNIGTSTVTFNTVFAKATSAQYADLAEWYTSDDGYPPGTVLSFGGTQEVTIATSVGDPRVAGVVSTQPAHIMNAGLKAPHVTAVALVGRAPTQVIGAVIKGDMMVSAGGGRAMSCTTPAMGTVIGKALEDHPGGQGIIEIVVGRQ